MNFVTAYVLLFATALFSLPRIVYAAPTTSPADMHATFVQSGGVQSARTREPLPFPGTTDVLVSDFIFTPDGTVYWNENVNEIESFTPSGLLRVIPVPHAGGNASSLLYARGDLWTFGDSGIVKVRPDGSARRWYPFTSRTSTIFVRQLAYGPDGGIYVLAVSSSTNGSAGQNLLYRIGANGTITSENLPVAPLSSDTRSAVFGTDGMLYFAYHSMNGLGVARVESDGSVTLFPLGNLSTVQSLVVSRGSIYFLTYTYQSKAANTVYELGRLTTAGAFSFTPLPSNGPNVYASFLAVDKGDNLWVTVATETDPPALFQFNVYNGRFNGAYRPATSTVFIGSPVIAPNDDVYIGYGRYPSFTLGFDVFPLSR